MHEIHPAHSIASWKEILLHIGIITVGLLMALGIDQTVEYFHHRHQLAEARKHLDIEMKINLLQYQQNLERYRREIPKMQEDIKLLNFLLAHPGTSRDKWPDRFSYGFICGWNLDHVAWDNMKAAGITSYMSYGEQYRIGSMYAAFLFLNDESLRCADAYRKIGKLMSDETDLSKMSPAQLQAAKDAIEDLLEDINRKILWMNLISRDTPEFPPPSDMPPIVNNRGDFQNSKEDTQRDQEMEKEYTDAVKQLKPDE